MTITIKQVYLLILFFAFAQLAKAQFTASQFNNSGQTASGDDYYIFCTTKDNLYAGGFIIQSELGNASFAWEKYDTLTNGFVDITGLYSISTDTTYSQIRGLDDGFYKVTVKTDVGGNVSEYKAWVLNNWIEIDFLEIPDTLSTCDGFKINTDFTYAPLYVWDTNTGEKSSVRITNNFNYAWTQNGESVSASKSPYVYNPIASDNPVPYSIEITDEFGCTGQGDVDYHSKVTKAAFDYTHDDNNEAVLEVEFSNNSINYDSAHWVFYKDHFRLSLLDEEERDETSDSIWFVLYHSNFDNAPIFEYEDAGDYPIKLVTIKINETTGNCYDTIYGSDIKVEEAMIEVPNVFTPNGDNANDYFVIRAMSLKSLNVKIYNRWGGLVHSWNYSNVRSSEEVYEEHTVWDGKIGNRWATPGVYYYVITYEGRDVWREDPQTEGENWSFDNITKAKGTTKKETQSGFIHLFRERVR